MTSGSTAFLVDTNIPVYAVDPRDAFKQQRAIDVLDRLDAGWTGVAGVQSLNQVMANLTDML